MKLNYVFFKGACLFGLTYQLSNGSYPMVVSVIGIYLTLYFVDLKNEKL